MDIYKINNKLLVLLLCLTACAEAPKIDLGAGNPSDKSYKAFFADGRPQGKVEPDPRVRLTDKDFTFSPLQPLYVQLNGILDVERDKKELWIKEFNIYWMASKTSIPSGAASASVGGAVGAALQILQDSKYEKAMQEFPEVESARCVFDASLRGKAIHIEVSKPSCPGEKPVCLFSYLSAPAHPTNDKSFREAAVEVTNLCIKEVVNKVKEIDQQYRVQ